jgi:hypothetical protein
MSTNSHFAFNLFGSSGGQKQTSSAVDVVGDRQLHESSETHNGLYDNGDIDLPPPPEDDSPCAKQEVKSEKQEDRSKKNNSPFNINHSSFKKHPWLWTAGLAGGFLLLERLTAPK